MYYVCLGMVKFMSKLSRNVRPDQAPKQVTEEDCAVYKRKQHRREYVWLRNIFPIENPPYAWKNLTDFPTTSKNVTTPSPIPLPEVCPNQFKHEWRGTCAVESDDTISDTPGKTLRLLYHANNAYWFYTNSAHGALGSSDQQNQNIIGGQYQSGYRVVVWLEDGSILRTHPTNLFYFCHSQYNMPSTERTYSPTHLPHDTKLKNILLKITRLLSSCMHVDAKPKQCWEMQIQPQQGNKCCDIFETTTIADLGRFSVADGSVQIRFDSGVTLHSSIDDQTFNHILYHGSRYIK